MKLKNIIINSSIIVMAITFIFFISENIPTDYFLDIIEMFFTILILSSIVLGILHRKNMLRIKPKSLKNLIILILVFGISLYSLYIYYINAFLNFQSLSLDRIMSLVVGIISFILLIKIRYDLDNNVA